MRGGINLGGGVDAMVHRYMALNAQARYHLASGHVSMLQVGAGLTVYPRGFSLLSPVRTLFHRPDASQGRIAVRLETGGAVPLADWDDRAGAGILAGAALRWHAARHYAIELAGMYMPNTEYDRSTGTQIPSGLPFVNRRLTGYQYVTLDHLLFLGTGRWKPLVLAGIGVYNVRQSDEFYVRQPDGSKIGDHDVHRQAAGGVTFGAGLDVRVLSRMALTGLVRYHDSLGEKYDLQVLSYSAALNFYVN